jgi:hypothetical protein
MFYACHVRRALLVVLCAVIGCKGDDVDTSAPSASVASELYQEAPEDAPPAGSQTRGQAESAGEKSDVAAGKLVAGSMPGDKGRDPALEPTTLEVDMGAFAIDRLPYPNDPKKPPLTGVNRDKASALCAERGARLCSELEWERACKGPDNQPYAGGSVWDPSCAAEPNRCASGFGVLAMGAAVREWTVSDVEAIKWLQPKAAAVRGARRDAAAVDHRCAHRSAIAADTEAEDLGFRCCHGAANTPTIASPHWRDAFRKADMPPSRLEKLFAANPRLAALAKDIKYFNEDAAGETVTKRGSERADAGAPPEGWRAATAPMIWNPLAGEEILLVTGQSGADSFIVAFHLLPGDRYRVAAAMVLKRELGPIAFLYHADERKKLHWTMCWGCPGETGLIRYLRDNRVSISQD